MTSLDSDLFSPPLTSLLRLSVPLTIASAGNQVQLRHSLVLPAPIIATFLFVPPPSSSGPPAPSYNHAFSCSRQPCLSVCELCCSAVREGARNRPLPLPRPRPRRRPNKYTPFLVHPCDSATVPYRVHTTHTRSISRQPQTPNQTPTANPRRLDPRPSSPRPARHPLTDDGLLFFFSRFEIFIRMPLNAISPRCPSPAI